MKLYYSPGACSLSPHIVALEAGIPLALEKVDLKAKTTASGKDYTAIAEKGAVPALELDNGQLLTEGVAIVQYLADLKPEANLAPKNGTFERVRLQETLNYISTEMHKGIGILFRGEALGPQAVEAFKGMLPKKFDYLSKQLAGKQYLTGDQFTVADAYLFTVLNWASMVKVDLAPWPALVAYQARVAARPAVKEAMKAEGLLEAKAA
jgi:glutathione S-transferase